MSGELASLDTSGFNRMIGDLVKLGGPGTNADAALHGEVVSLLKRCVEDSPSASVESIRRRADYRYSEKYAVRGTGDLKLTYNTGERGGDPNNVWLRSGGKFHIMVGPGRWSPQPDKSGRFSPGAHSRMAPGGARWPDWLWAQYQALEVQTPQERAALKEAWFEKAKASRGLLKASWGQVASALGISVEQIGVPIYAARARGSDGKSYLNGTGQRTSDDSSLTYTLRNAIPTSNLLDIAEGAVAARLAAFDKAMEVGVFADIEQIAKRYPGLLAV